MPYLILHGIPVEEAKTIVPQMLANPETNPDERDHGHRFSYGVVMRDGEEVYTIYCGNCSRWSECGEHGKPGPMCRLWNNAVNYPGCTPEWADSVEARDGDSA